MKNCKKLTAVLLAMIMLLSVCIFAVTAESDNAAETTAVTTTSSNASAEDLTYVYPTGETTTEKDIYGPLDESLKEDLSNIGDNIRDTVPVFEQFFEKIRGFLRLLIDFFKELSEVAFN